LFSVRAAILALGIDLSPRAVIPAAAKRRAGNQDNTR
jgi:hypothetical protein